MVKLQRLDGIPVETIEPRKDEMLLKGGLLAQTFVGASGNVYERIRSPREPGSPHVWFRLVDEEAPV